MKNSKTVIGLVLLVAILLVAVGYAAITAVTLNITGSAAASASAENGNFVVEFTKAETDKSNANATAVVDAGITDVLNATIDVSGLTAKGEYVTATYTVANNSKDLSADISTQLVKNTNADFFTVTTEVEGATTIAKGTSTTVTVKVELAKTPIDELPAELTSEIEVAVVADPVQPQ